MNQYDIIIVGAGPAGSTFARIADKSLKILIIDGNSRGKPCGGLLAPDAQKALAQFDLTLPKEILVDPQIFSVRTIDLKTKLERYYQRMYINLDRNKFDSWLLTLLPDNVHIKQGRCINIEEKDLQYYVTYRTDNGNSGACSKILIGADGASSIVRRLMCKPLKTRKYVAIQQWFPLEEKNRRPFYSCIFDRAATDCCSWSIHKDDVMIFGGAFAPENCRQSFEKQKERLQQFGFHFTEPIYTESCMVLRPDSLKSFDCGHDNIFLLGEAAGMISPSSLEGISSAILSAVALCESIKSRNPQAAYKKHTRKLRWKLFLKNLKCPFMYNGFLRKIVMNMGIMSIHVEKR